MIGESDYNLIILILPFSESNKLSLSRLPNRKGSLHVTLSLISNNDLSRFYFKSHVSLCFLSLFHTSVLWCNLFSTPISLRPVYCVQCRRLGGVGSSPIVSGSSATLALSVSFWWTRRRSYALTLLLIYILTIVCF